MKKAVLSLVFLFFVSLSFGQGTESEKMITLAKAYKDFMFTNQPSSDVLKNIRSNVPEKLQTATEFIVQTITTKNKLLTQQFLARPNDPTLKQIFIIDAINQNLREENQVDNFKLIDSLNAKVISGYELLDNYYGMLFASVGNKNQPFNLSKNDFKLNEYNLKDDAEKGILFLRCMKSCGSFIWGYMNVVKPPNTKTALEFINKFPKFNGQPYFQYTDFYFKDFEMNIIIGEGLQSYKSHYLDKYYETLIYHMICLNKEGKSEKERNALLLGSILKEKNLYKYTQFKDILEKNFQEVNKK